MKQPVSHMTQPVFALVLFVTVAERTEHLTEPDLGSIPGQRSDILFIYLFINLMSYQPDVMST